MTPVGDAHWRDGGAWSERVLMGRHGTGETYTTDSGQLMLDVHANSPECQEHGCPIHNPSDRAVAIGTTHYNTERQRMDRVCEHGLAHPDPDSQDWRERHFGDRDDEHDCDGCCAHPR